MKGVNLGRYNNPKMAFSHYPSWRWWWKNQQPSLNFPILPYRRNQRLVQVPCSLVLQRMNCYPSAIGTRCPKLCCACTWRDRLLRHRVMWELKDKHSFSRYDVSSNLSQFCVGALSKSLNCAPRRDTVHSYCLSSPGDVTVYQLTVRLIWHKAGGGNLVTN